MGARVYFNTGFEYKFPPGIQPIADILKFGGLDHGQDDETGAYHHEWNYKDQLTIISELMLIRGMLAFEDPTNFDKYDNSAEGTKLLYSDLRENLLGNYGHNNPRIHLFILGTLLFHQLLYESSLKADYEA